MSHTSTPQHHASAHKTARRATRKQAVQPGHTAPALPRLRRDVADGDCGEAGGLASVVLSALFALPFMVGIGLILLLVMTGIVLSTGNPDAMMTPIALAVLGVSALVGGIISARRCGSRGLLCGLCSGFLFTLLLWILTFFINRSDPLMTLGISAWGRVALHAAVVVVATCGGATCGGAHCVGALTRGR